MKKKILECYESNGLELFGQLPCEMSCTNIRLHALCRSAEKQAIGKLLWHYI